MMALHHALESAAFAHAHNVDKSLTFKNIHQHAIAGFYRAIALAFFINFERHFAHEFNRRKIVLSKMSTHWLGEPRLLDKFH